MLLVEKIGVFIQGWGLLITHSRCVWWRVLRLELTGVDLTDQVVFLLLLYLLITDCISALLDALRGVLVEHLIVPPVAEDGRQESATGLRSAPLRSGWVFVDERDV